MLASPIILVILTYDFAFLPMLPNINSDSDRT